MGSEPLRIEWEGGEQPVVGGVGVFVLQRLLRALARLDDTGHPGQQLVRALGQTAPTTLAVCAEERPQ